MNGGQKMPNPCSCNYNQSGSTSCNLCGSLSLCYCIPNCDCSACSDKKTTAYNKANDCPCGAWRETYTWESGRTEYIPYPRPPRCTCE